MATKAGDIVKDALTEITVLGAEAPVEPTDAQGAIRYMNRMMATLDAKGIDLGYTEVTSFADDITVPAGAIEGIVFLLATRLWTQYTEVGAPLPQSLIISAKSGVDAMRVLAVTVGQTEYGDTLPIGSGNEGDGIRTWHFYPDLQDDILAESTGSIGLEESTT